MASSFRVVQEWFNSRISEFEGTTMENKEIVDIVNAENPYADVYKCYYHPGTHKLGVLHIQTEQWFDKTPLYFQRRCLRNHRPLVDVLIAIEHVARAILNRHRKKSTWIISHKVFLLHEHGEELEEVKKQYPGDSTLAAINHVLDSRFCNFYLPLLELCKSK
jgi:hypothetical protein